MSALKIQSTLKTIEREMSRIAPHRNFALFETFLIKGYSFITLDSVAESRRSDLLRAKLCLGTLITLYDDFADRPTQANAPLLEVLYHLRFGNRRMRIPFESSRLDVIDFAQLLFTEIEDVLQPLPNYSRFIDVLNFDLLQFYSANQFGSLLTAQPALNNRLENRLYMHHNMGLCMVTTMDLMASEEVASTELGMMREVFVRGQRMSRIFNVLVTRKRELLDGDITGELSTFENREQIEIAVRGLRREIIYLRNQLKTYETLIRTFSVKAYTEGLMKVQKLHEQMEDVI